jgi:ABC-2 type transport system ATP-binding protein
MDEAERCSRVGFLSAGRLLTVGTPQELKRAYPFEVLELRVPSARPAMTRAQEIDGVLDVQVFGEALHLVVEDARAALEPVRSSLKRAGLEVLILRKIMPTMEDVFMALLRGSE